MAKSINYALIHWELQMLRFRREFAEIIQSRVPEFCLTGKSKLKEINDELKALNYSAEDDNKPLNYKIQVSIFY